VVRDFFKEALAGQPPVPVRAPPGVKLVRVNLKTGLPAGTSDPKAIMEAFKPTQEPLGAVAEDAEGAEGAEGMVPQEYGEAAPQGVYPGVIPGAPPPPPGPYQTPGSDRALTSGTGGLY
jgi:penicillin-binding protein 1A